MSRFDETVRPTATRLIERGGTAVTLRRAEVPSYDPVTGAVSATSIDVQTTGVLEDVETGHPDGVVRRGDRMVTLAADPLQIDPAPGDDLIVGEVVHRVVSVSATYAGDRPAIFRLHIRR